MKIYIFLLVTFFWSTNVMAEKYALIIAIGNYPVKTGWSTISSLNDVPLIRQSLIDQQFKDNNISVITDEKATRAGILTAIAELNAKLKAGDIVVIHYSGHGQQIFDDNGDEVDGKDEALVPYDALVKYTSNYHGENHIRDDELGVVITNIRNALGKNGQFLMLLDSCHSGTASRGGKARGGKPTLAPANWRFNGEKDATASGMIEPVKLNEDASPFVIISGASADELNYEADGVGSLSYAFSKSMSALGTDVTYRTLFSSIASIINTISPKQTPSIEGDVDFKLFLGDYVKQQPYFEVAKISRSDIIKINSGKLNNLFKGTTVFVAASGTNQVISENIITRGTIINSSYNDAIIRLDTPLKDKNNMAYWVFIDQTVYEDIAVNVFFDETMKTKSAKSSITNFLNKNNLGTVVTDSLNASLIISESENELALYTSNGKNAIYTQDLSINNYNYEDAQEAIFDYARGTYLKNLSLKNMSYEFEFRLLPISNDLTSSKDTTLINSSFYNNAGKFLVNTTSDTVHLEVTNKSDQFIYFSIIEINSKGEISSFMPNDMGDCPYNHNDLKIPPGKTKLFDECFFSFSAPYETLILKGFATANPINLKPTIQSRGASNIDVTNTNPIERFIGETYDLSRGSSGNNKKGRVDGYSAEFIYEIVKNKPNN